MKNYNYNLCPLCNRELANSESTHHLIPRQYKGKETVKIHSICHQKIHSTFSEKELRDNFNTIEKLLKNEEILKFLKWVEKKDPDFYDTNKESDKRKSKRRKKH